MSTRFFTHVAVALLAVLSAACTTAQYPSGTPFLCAGDRQCPPGFVCDSNLCVRADSPPLPAFVGESMAPLVPEMHPDPDRQGVVICWTRREERQNPRGAVYGAFISGDGHAHGPVVLAEFDTRSRDFLVSCAPVPGSGGQVLVEAWFQTGSVGQTGVISETRVVRWTPHMMNGFEGVSTPYYDEVSQDTVAGLLPGEIRMVVIGNEAWVPIAQSHGHDPVSPFPYLRVVRLRVNAAALDSGQPVREVVIEPGPSVDVQTLTLHESDGGAWAIMGRPFIYLAFVPTTLPTPPQFVSAVASTPSTAAGFAIPLGTFGQFDGRRAPELAALWNDPSQDRGIGTLYRVAWYRREDGRAAIGPLLPFTRIETPRPGSFVIGDWLYVFGAPSDVDADAGNASPGDIATGLVPATFEMYRIPWGAVETSSIERVRSIPRGMSRAPVTAAAASVLPGGESFALAWVEFNRANSANQGVRYALYFARFPL